MAPPTRSALARAGGCIRITAQGYGAVRSMRGRPGGCHPRYARTFLTRSRRRAKLAPMTDRAADAEPRGRWRLLAILATAQLLAFAPWFSASAVAPLLQADWSLGRLDLPYLTIAVQLGFAAGALTLAATGAADVVSGRYLLAGGATVAAIANIGFAWLAHDVATAIPFRVVTGAALAGVYPIAIKILAGWFGRDRGVAVGVLVGALTVGSALPFLFRAVGALGGADWRVVVTTASVAAVAGALIGLVGVRDGPNLVRAPRFSLSMAARAFRGGSVRLANLGYLGHMWELYAMWTWAPLFIAASFAAGGRDAIRHWPASARSRSSLSAGSAAS